MWTVVLLTVGITALVLAARYWWGFLVGACSEGLWVAYAVHTHDHALFLMAWAWLAANLYAARTARKVRA